MPGVFSIWSQLKVRWITRAPAVTAPWSRTSWLAAESASFARVLARIPIEAHAEERKLLVTKTGDLSEYVCNWKTAFPTAYCTNPTPGARYQSCVPPSLPRNVYRCTPLNRPAGVSTVKPDAVNVTLPRGCCHTRPTSAEYWNNTAGRSN